MAPTGGVREIDVGGGALAGTSRSHSADGSRRWKVTAGVEVGGAGVEVGLEGEVGVEVGVRDVGQMMPLTPEATTPASQPGTSRVRQTVGNQR